MPAAGPAAVPVGGAGRPPVEESAPGAGRLGNARPRPLAFAGLQTEPPLDALPPRRRSQVPASDNPRGVWSAPGAPVPAQGGGTEEEEPDIELSDADQLFFSLLREEYVPRPAPRKPKKAPAVKTQVSRRPNEGRGADASGAPVRRPLSKGNSRGGGGDGAAEAAASRGRPASRGRGSSLGGGDDGEPEMSEEDRIFFAMLRSDPGRPEPRGFLAGGRKDADPKKVDPMEVPLNPGKRTSYLVPPGRENVAPGEPEGWRMGPEGALGLPDHVRARLTPPREPPKPRPTGQAAPPPAARERVPGGGQRPVWGQGFEGTSFEHQKGKVDVPLRSSASASSRASGVRAAPKRSSAVTGGTRGRGGRAPAVKTKGSKDPETRQMFDKRQSRRQNLESFSEAINEYRANALTPGGSSEARGPALAPGSAHVEVYVRKRPLFPHEEAKSEFDVVTVTGPQRAVVHNCQMYPDLKRMFIRHQGFPCARAFGDDEDSAAVYGRAAFPLVEGALQGGVAGLFMYGQTGSGKTFTMTDLERLASEHIFQRLKEDGSGGYVEVSMFELAGKRILDLLSPCEAEIALKETPDLTFQPVGATSLCAGDTSQLEQIIAEGKSRRATHGTDVNACSSRSHAILRLTVVTDTLRGGYSSGRLTLVDCAGSERKEDSMYHSAERRLESQEINASLYALKECFRLQSQRRSHPKKHVHVPYRNNNLTRALSECFTRSDAQMAVICTLSPSAKDTEHSIATLKTGCLMAGTEGLCTDKRVEVKKRFTDLRGRVLAEKVSRPTDPGRWKPLDVQRWFQALKFSSRTQGCRVPTTLDGRQLVRMTDSQFSNLCGGDTKAGNFFHRALRAEMECCRKELDKQRSDRLAISGATRFRGM